LAQDAVGQDRAADLTVEFLYKRSGEYLLGLSARTKSAGAKFIRKLVLPRWCALIKWYLGDAAIAEFIYDTTDIVRSSENPNRELLRGIVCLDPELADDLKLLACAWKVPCLAG
jgi:hypothetical protein